MFDFPMTEPSVGTAVYCLLAYLFILCFNYKNALKNPYLYPVKKSKKQLFIILACFIIITFCQKGDFFHLMWHIYDYEFIPRAYNYGEPIYIEIAQLVEKNYFFFRIIVWGGAFTLFCLTARRLRVPVYYAIIFLFCSYIILFAYARATAAMAVYFFGLSFLCKPIKNKEPLSYIIGLIVIYTSWEFHNSAIIMIIITSFIFIPLSKWSIALILIGIPFVVTIAKGYFYEIMIFAEESESAVGERMSRYSQSEKGSTVAETLLGTFKYLSFYIPIIISTITILTKNNIKKISVPIIRMYKIAFGIIFMASTLYLFGETFYVMFYRVLYMSMIPLSIVITALYKEKYITIKQFRWCYMFGIIHTILGLTYTTYDIIVNS